jgi:hypothetical protein
MIYSFADITRFGGGRARRIRQAQGIQKGQGNRSLGVNTDCRFFSSMIISAKYLNVFLGRKQRLKSLVVIASPEFFTQRFERVRNRPKLPLGNANGLRLLSTPTKP